MYRLSEQLINGIHINQNPSCLILDMINLLTNLKNKNKVVKFLWIPSHSGIARNERVDQLAQSSIAKRKIYPAKCLEYI